MTDRGTGAEERWYDPSGHSGERALLRWRTPFDPALPPEPGWRAYALGYRRAFERLVDSIPMQQGHDTLVYPIVWLARHAMEVALKALIVAFKEELGMGEGFKLNHNLLGLREKAERLVRKLGAEEDEALSRVREGIAKIAGLDPDGTRFRYPEARDGTPSTTEAAINLDVLSEVVIGVLDALEAERAWVEDEGEDRRMQAAEEAANEWLASLPDEVRDEYINEEEQIWSAWMMEASRD